MNPLPTLLEYLKAKGAKPVSVVIHPDKAAKMRWWLDDWDHPGAIVANPTLGDVLAAQNLEADPPTLVDSNKGK